MNPGFFLDDAVKKNRVSFKLYVASNWGLAQDRGRASCGVLLTEVMLICLALSFFRIGVLKPLLWSIAQLNLSVQQGEYSG